MLTLRKNVQPVRSREVKLLRHLELREKTMKKLTTLGLTALLLSTTCGAYADDAQKPVGPAKEFVIPPQLGDIRVKTAEPGRPAGLENMMSPGTIQQVPTAMPELPQTPESMEKVHKLEKEGERLFASNLADQALIKWQEAYGLCLEMKYAEGQGRQLTNMCRVFLSRGQYVKAKYMGENAIEILGETSNKADLGKARVALAQAYFGLDNSVWAGSQLEMALKNYQEVGNTSATDSAQLTAICAGVLLRMGKLKESLMFLQSCSTYLEQGGEYHSSVAKRVASTSVMLGLGLYTAALEEANRALATARNSKNPASMPVALACIANCYYCLGEYGNSLRSFEDCFKETAKLSEKMPMPDLSRANLELGYAHSLMGCGYYEQARSPLAKATELFKKESNATGQAQASNALGVVEESFGNHEKAMVHFQQALDLHAVANQKSEKLQIAITQNLAAAESRAGKNTEAKLHLASVMAAFTRAKNPMEDQLLECRSMFSLGEVLLKLSDTQIAESRLKDAVTLANRINDDATLWRAYTLLAKIAQNDPNAQTPVGDLLNSALSHYRSPQAGVFASPEKLNYPTTRQDLGEQLVALLAKHKMPQQALVAAEQLKDELFIVEWNRRGGRVKPEDADVYNDLMSLRAHLHACEDASSPSTLTKEWQKWMERFRALVAENRRLARLIAPVPVSVEQILASVRENNATMVDYLVGGTSSVVFTMDGTGRLSATVIPVGQARLKDQVTALINGAQSAAGSDPAANERLILQTLYRELIPAPVKAMLPSNPDQLVVIVPDGVLYNLPFAALVNDQGKYLVESHTLTMASSLGMFMDSPPKYTDEKSLVVTSGGGNQNGDDTSLITQLFQPELTTRLIGKETAIATIQENGRGKAVLHFGSKFPLHEKNPMDSVLPFAPAKEDNGKKVTADKLMGLSLPSDLLVWNGSSIYGKDIQGNAVKMFSSGLNYAGVRNVLISLWAEPSTERNAELIDFYKNQHAGMNQAQSLRKAQMLAISKDPSAKAWAAFQLLGPGF